MLSRWGPGALARELLPLLGNAGANGRLLLPFVQQPLAASVPRQWKSIAYLIICATSRHHVSMQPSTTLGCLPMPPASGAWQDVDTISLQEAASLGTMASDMNLCFLQCCQRLP